MIVLDASAALELLLRTPAGLIIEELALGPRSTVHAPHLIDLEIAQVLRRYVRQGDMDRGRARQALLDLADLPLERYPHEPFLPRIWELRENLTAYDAAYVVLAEVLRAELVTMDGPLARATGHLAKVVAFQPPSS